MSTTTTTIQFFLMLPLLLLLVSSVVVVSAEDDVHEFYLELIQGEGSVAASSCTEEFRSMLGDRVIYNVQQFFMVTDISLDGEVEMDVLEEDPGDDSSNVFVPSGGSCCSHNHMDCTGDPWCNESSDNCGQCNDVWIEQGSCQALGGIARWGECTNDVNGCCPGLECIGNVHYRQCDRPQSISRRSLEHDDDARKEDKEQPSEQQGRHLQGEPEQQHQRSRSLYYSHWVQQYSAAGRLVCRYCSFENDGLDLGGGRQLQQKQHHGLRHSRRGRILSAQHEYLIQHSEFEAYISYHLSKDVRAYLLANNLNCLGDDVDSVEVYFSQEQAIPSSP